MAYTTVYRFLRRLPDDTIENVLGESVRRLRRSSRRGRRRAAVAVDGTGLLPHGVSTYFIRRVEQESNGKTRSRHFLKWIVVADVDRQIVLAQRARQGPSNDAPTLPGLLETAGRSIPLGLVSADAEFDSEANHRHIRATGALSVIPARRRRRAPWRNPQPDVPQTSSQAVRTTRQSRNGVLSNQTQTLRPSPRSHSTHASPSSADTWPGL